MPCELGMLSKRLGKEGWQAGSGQEGPSGKGEKAQRLAQAK